MYDDKCRKYHNQRNIHGYAVIKRRIFSHAADIYPVQSCPRYGRKSDIPSCSKNPLSTIRKPAIPQPMYFLWSATLHAQMISPSIVPLSHDSRNVNQQAESGVKHRSTLPETTIKLFLTIFEVI